MADLGTLALGTFANVNDTAIQGSDPVLETIAGTDDADYAYDAANTTHTGTASFALADVPADFLDMDTLSIRLRYALQSGTRVNTWSSLTAQVVQSDGSTPLTNEVTVASNITTTTPTNSGVITLTGLNTTANKATWDGALVLLRWNITKSMGGDTLEKRVFAAEVTGTYTVDVDVTAPVLTAQTVGSLTTGGGTPAVTTDEGNGTAYMVVVPNGDFDALSGAERITRTKAGQQSSGAAALAAQNQAVTATGVQTFSAVTGLSSRTAYDCWFVHTDAAANDSTAVKADFTTLPVFADIVNDLTAGCTSAQSEAGGWNAKVRDALKITWVRTSDTVATGTLQAVSDVDITAQETITVTVPGIAVVSGSPIVATPSFTVDPIAGITGDGTIALGLGLTADGQVAIAGDGTIPLALAAAGAGAVEVAGEGSIPLALSISGAGGSPEINGEGAIPLALSVSGAGQVAVQGEAQVPLPLALSGDGAVAIEGAGAVPLSLVASGLGSAAISGDGAIPLSLSLAGAGAVLIVGAGNIPLLLGVSGAGTLGPAPISGQGLINLAFGVAATGTVEVNGSGVIPLALAVDAAGSVLIVGAGLIPLQLEVSGTGAEGEAENTGSGLIGLALGIAGAGTVDVGGGGVIPLELGVSAQGTVEIAGSGTLPLSLDVDGEGSVAIGGEGAIPLALALSGQGAVLVQGEAAIALQLVLRGQGATVVVAVSDRIRLVLDKSSITADLGPSNRGIPLVPSAIGQLDESAIELEMAQV